MNASPSPTHRTPLSPRRLPTVASALAALLLAAAPAAAQTQGDRQLLRFNSQDPYLFILFDTSQSMTWTATCSQEDIDAGKCDFLCETLNCPVPMGGDDPNSKIYQAKEALYTVLNENPDYQDIHFGFASLNQDQLAVGAKHWIYTVSTLTGENGITLPADLAELFTVGTDDVFGAVAGSSPPFNYGCDRFEPSTDNSGGGFDTDYEVGCWPNSADAVAMNGTARSEWNLDKLRRLPKGGVDGTVDVSYYVRITSGNTTTAIYEVTYVGEAIDYDTELTFDIQVDIASCTIGADGTGAAAVCTPIAGNLKVDYERTEDTSFFFSEGLLNRNTGDTDMTEVAYFGGFPDEDPELGDIDHDDPGTDGVFWASDVWAADTCRGWEPSGTAYPSNVVNEPPVLSNLDTDEYDETVWDDPVYNLRFPDEGESFDLTGTDWDGYQWLMQIGDVIPLDWEQTNFQKILDRLAPGGDPAVFPDTFKQAVYFEDDYGAQADATAEGFLRLKDEDQRPLIGVGQTPLAGWFSFFRAWFSGCGKPGNCENVGWNDIASFYDPDFACRKKYVLMITDGSETCDGSPSTNALDYYGDYTDSFPNGFERGPNADQCRYRASLKAQEGVESLVLGFGVENKAKLQCANTPVVYVDNKEELIQEIRDFLDSVLEQAASFASAAVPTVQANVADKIYLSSFVPLNDEAVWPGRIDTFLKPLPLDDSNLPDRTQVCDPFDPNADPTDETNTLAQCFTWDAGDSQLAWDDEAGYDPQGLLLQAPLGSDITRYTNTSLQIGVDDDERRVFFGLPDDTSSTSKLQWFQYPEDPITNPTSTEQLEFEYLWNLPIPDIADLDYVTQRTANREAIADVIEFTLKEKQATIDNPGGDPINVQYVMGDIFHSNPLVLNPPANFDFYAKDPYWNAGLCGDDVDTTRNRGAQISYQYFSNKNLCRRIMLFAGSNDGQLHAFDSGMFWGDDCQLNLPASAPGRDELADEDRPDGDYDYGTGKEVFSFIPSTIMPVIKELSEIDELTNEYGVDGSPLAADVFVDPVLESDGSATCGDREWRTLVFSNYREGGPGFFALDVTQPDVFGTGLVPEPSGGARENTTNYVPSCLPDYGEATPADCGDLPFPALRWEFRDLDENGIEADDDANGVTDLAESWSRPFIGRLRVCRGACADDGTLEEDLFVAVFGGGLPEEPTNSAADESGNWLYIVDVETGEPVYKRGGSGMGTTSPIVGAVATDVAGLDDNVDGYVDTLYFGTTAGYLYKVSLGTDPLELDETTGRIEDPTDDAGKYDPFQVFDTGGRPIYLEPTIVFVPRMGANAILFGTGNRWNLWDFGAGDARFYALLDRNENAAGEWQDADRDGVVDGTSVCGSCPSPLTESQYFGIDPASTAGVANYLFGADPNYLPGWYFTLLDDEKLITEPFSLSGITFFTVFSPTQVELQGTNTGVCSYTGESKIFIVNTVTTEGYAVQEGSTDRTRYSTTATFTTQPYTEPSLTKNPVKGNADNADAWTSALAEINADLRRLFPPGARFSDYTIDIKTIRSDTGVVFIAPVPVAIEQNNWKEF